MASFTFEFLNCEFPFGCHWSDIDYFKIVISWILTTCYFISSPHYSTYTASFSGRCCGWSNDHWLSGNCKDCFERFLWSAFPSIVSKLLYPSFIYFLAIISELSVTLPVKQWCHQELCSRQIGTWNWQLYLNTVGTYFPDNWFIDTWYFYKFKVC